MEVLYRNRRGYFGGQDPICDGGKALRTNADEDLGKEVGKSGIESDHAWE
jgi:hypothetical protein